MNSVLEYKCPCCGGKITFDSGEQKMKCPYCDTTFEVETLKQYDQILNEQQPDELHWEKQPGAEWQEGEEEQVAVYTCQSCGGEIVCEQTTAATSCPFCGNPVVMTGQLSGDLKPDYVIPFKLDKKAAKEALNRHLSNKKLLPGVFKEQNHIEEIQGVYVPFWLFDAEVQADIHYRGTKVRVWSDANYSYTDTGSYSITRSGALSFEHVPVDGSSKMADDLMEAIEPFHFEDAVPFQTAYLSGYLANRYDVDGEESMKRAGERLKTSTEQAFAATLDGYNQVTMESSSVKLSNSKAKYALYPVWILNTKWNRQNYTFAMNGQTGKLVGDLPMDKGAFAKWFVIYMLAFGAVLFMILWLLWLVNF